VTGEAERVVIVTGASRGIGAATARLAARRGYSVCVNYRQDRKAALGVVEEIEKLGRRAVRSPRTSRGKKTWCVCSMPATARSAL
jgi:NAD(P)-dependent dehydrogenase (short-subunit alcohol dehydrogenase family)